MYVQVGDVSDRLKKVERRLKSLDEHIRNADNYFKYRDIHRQYLKLPAKKQDAFYETDCTELVLYEVAETYLRGVMNGRTTIPTAARKKEAAQLNVERQTLYAKYTRLKEEVKDAEVIRRCVETVLYEPQVKRSREHEVEL